MTQGPRRIGTLGNSKKKKLPDEKNLVEFCYVPFGKLNPLERRIMYSIGERRKSEVK
jgi:hypothetical protein